MGWLSSQTNQQAFLTSGVCITAVQLTLPPGIILCLRENGYLPSTIRISLFPDLSFIYCSLHPRSTQLPGAPVGWYGDQTKKKFMYD